jgi:hypothetical protein
MHSAGRDTTSTRSRWLPTHGYANHLIHVAPAHTENPATTPRRHRSATHRARIYRPWCSDPYCICIAIMGRTSNVVSGVRQLRSRRNREPRRDGTSCPTERIWSAVAGTRPPRKARYCPASQKGYVAIAKYAQLTSERGAEEPPLTHKRALRAPTQAGCISQTVARPMRRCLDGPKPPTPAPACQPHRTFQPSTMAESQRVTETPSLPRRFDTRYFELLSRTRVLRPAATHVNPGVNDGD